MSSEPRPCDRIQTKLTERRVKKKGYGNALHIGWDKVKEAVSAGHSDFFQRRGMEVPPATFIPFGEPKLKKVKEDQP